jgi:hypothetical protein
VEAAASNPGICSQLLSFGTFSTGRKKERGRAYETHKYLYISPTRCQEQVALNGTPVRNRERIRSIERCNETKRCPNLDLHGSNKSLMRETLEEVENKVTPKEALGIETLFRIWDDSNLRNLERKEERERA